MQLDKFDHKILSLLQEDASLSAADIGDRIGLSQSQCWRRIERLESDGVIVKRVAVVDRKKLGLNVMIFAHVKLIGHGKEALPDFFAAIKRFPEVLDCHVLLGAVDFMLRIVTRDMESYERFFFDRLSRLPMVQEVHSMIALTEIKAATALPMNLVAFESRPAETRKAPAAKRR
ncbi:Lrp/AsnC family transcriptional regulator [Solimonas terrae]|uniref:Lrp/AsnC family transcriptional regulator n=1 Tax=Solimonas terrae TaxID=1396819 RepID=A0A6M2BM64_9GAMM|nr:Lrp/AsnC family transcriptional regulator [Solimonas terrae]NGY03245.1 Lrp/AsnC family transcriptional regulator [Solimonas terrae]